MINKTEEFTTLLKEAVQALASQRADELIEKKPEEYYTGTADYGYYNNGLGMACYGTESTYDEAKAYDDAIEELSIDIANGSQNLETVSKLFIDNNKLSTALAQLVATF